MKRVVLYCALLLSTFVVISHSQTETSAESDIRDAFEKWKSAPKTEGKKPVFIVAHAERLDDVSATVSIGLATHGLGFNISVRPLKIEREEKFKSIRTSFMEAASLATKPKTPAGDFANPRMTFKVPAEANALEIQIKYGDSTEPAILTMKLIGKTSAQLVSD